MSDTATMVELIKARGVRDPNVLKAMRAVPRHRFIPGVSRARAYGDYPLSIGHGQTISQPYIVALMTEALELEPGDKVLEVGTGSGYQTAILAEMGMEVYTVEVVPELAARARETLEALGYEHVHYRVGDGWQGWPAHAPYDGIIVTAAPPQIPDPLIEQLTDGGHLVIPVGPPGYYQTLWKVTRVGDEVRKQDLGGVAFVPLVHANTT
ncbi:MAG: protein-L-isoaspartate(D-aspartate) O-methyltransferase [Anaerolineae bacterium]